MAKKMVVDDDGVVVDRVPIVRHAYSYREPVILESSGVSKTKQSFKDECDINRIMARYAATGTLDFVNRREAQFLDVSDIDFQNAMRIVTESREAFMTLPAAVRDRFQNDPGQLLGFLSDDSNREEAIKLGLVIKPISAGEVPGGVAAAGTETVQQGKSST